MIKLVNHVLDQHVMTLAFLIFAAVGAEQAIAGKIDYATLLHSTPLAIATAGVAGARGLSAVTSKKK